MFRTTMILTTCHQYFSACFVCLLIWGRVFAVVAVVAVVAIVVAVVVFVFNCFVFVLFVYC